MFSGELLMRLKTNIEIPKYKINSAKTVGSAFKAQSFGVVGRGKENISSALMSMKQVPAIASMISIACIVIGSYGSRKLVSPSHNGNEEKRRTGRFVLMLVNVTEHV